MTPFYRCNSNVLTVERRGAIDRYGNAQSNVVLSDFACYMERSSRFFFSVTGASGRVDATLMCEEELREEDVITLDDRFRTKWKVFTIESALDSRGVVLYWVYGLTKQRGEDAASS